MSTADPQSQPDLTQLLHRWRDGDRDAFDAMLPHVYDRLRIMARSRLRSENEGHTLDTVGLIHEAYLRMTQGANADWQDRAHFFAVASTAMRRVLIDHAKMRSAEKRGGGQVHVELDPERLGDAGLAADTEPDALLSLNDALAKLELEFPRHAKAVELRYFGGLTLEEVGEALGISAPTAMRDLRFAQAWLARLLTEEK
ncbi:MAG TPA: ECF-type sigma factor [Gemmatimonadaceae bacterium]|nr:ECF-type sigma factor [Gemmatimonadaceae bacterium]